MKHKTWSWVEYEGRLYRVLSSLPWRDKGWIELYDPETRKFVEAHEDECRRVPENADQENRA